MAIALDATAQAVDSQASPATWSHTCTGSDRFLFVITRLASSATVVSVDYGGNAMTRVLSTLSPTGDTRFNDLWYLANPPSGSNTVTVTYNGGGTVFRAASASYTGVNATGNPEVSNQDTQLTAQLDVSVTTTTDNDWLVGLGIQYNNGEVAGTTARVAYGGLVTTDGYNLLDSNGAKSPAGSYSLGIKNTVAGNSGLTVVAIKPTGGAVAARVPQLLMTHVG